MSALQPAVTARDAAQAAVNEAVAAEFPVNTPVEINGVRGAVRGHVVGTENEMVLVKVKETVNRRHWEKVTKLTGIS